MPGLVFESVHPPMAATSDITRITWNDRPLFPPPDPRAESDHIREGHSGELKVVGEWNADGLHRWVFNASGIDDCNGYGVWVLDVKDGRATMRRVFRGCIFYGVAILTWTPVARVLVTTSTPKLEVVRLAIPLDPDVQR